MYYQQNFNKQTNWLLGVFLLLTVFAGFYSELFQAPQKAFDQQSLFKNPLSKSFLNKTHTLQYVSRIENLTLQKNRNSWHLTSPRKILADKQTLMMLFEALEFIKVRKIYPKDAINVNNFSLNDPLLKLKLETDEKIVEVNLGIINPVDQSAYLSTSLSEYIFQIEILKFPIETFGLSDFIDSRVIPLDKSILAELSVYRGQAKGKPWFELTRSNDAWASDSKKELNQEKVDKYLNALLDSRSHTIFDELTESQEETIAKFFEKPTYTVKVKTTAGEEFEYTFGSIYREVAELKIEKRKHVIIKSNQRHNFLLCDRDILEILGKSLNSFLQRRI